MKLYDHVKIKSSGITGVIVDIFGERFIRRIRYRTRPRRHERLSGAVAIVHLPASELELLK